MSAKIKLGETIAVIDGMFWTVESGDHRWAEILNEDIPIEGPSPSDPDPDLTQAESAVKNYGAVIVSNDNKDSGEAVY